MSSYYRYLPRVLWMDDLWCHLRTWSSDSVQIRQRGSWSRGNFTSWPSNCWLNSLAKLTRCLIFQVRQVFNVFELGFAGDANLWCRWSEMRNVTRSARYRTAGHCRSRLLDLQVLQGPWSSRHQSLTVGRETHSSLLSVKIYFISRRNSDESTELRRGHERLTNYKSALNHAWTILFFSKNSINTFS